MHGAEVAREGFAVAQQHERLAARSRCKDRCEIECIVLCGAPELRWSDNVTGRRVAKLARERWKVAIEIKDQRRWFLAEAVGIERLVGADDPVDLCGGGAKGVVPAITNRAVGQKEEIDKDRAGGDGDHRRKEEAPPRADQSAIFARRAIVRRNSQDKPGEHHGGNRPEREQI